MSTAQDDRNASRYVAPVATAALAMLVVAMGYMVSPEVEGASALPPVTEEEDMALRYLQSECVAGGLVFASCNLDFSQARCASQQTPCPYACSLGSRGAIRIARCGPDPSHRPCPDLIERRGIRLILKRRSAGENPRIRYT